LPTASFWNKVKLWRVSFSAPKLVVLFHGLSDAHGDLLRGLQVVETAAAITTSLLGDKLEGKLSSSILARDSPVPCSTVSKDMDTYVRKVPLGVCASVAPFNFPAYVESNSMFTSNPPRSMIPLWTVPLAVATGNTLVLKPSERDPGAAMMIAELCQRAGSEITLSNL